MNKETINNKLIALRYNIRSCPPGQYTNDPFIAYQEGWISKRKLISIIAEHLIEVDYEKLSHL